MAFQPVRGARLDPAFLADVIIANSTTLTVGDAVKTNTSGFLAVATAAAPLLGIVIGFKTSSDTPLTPSAYAKGTTAILPETESYAAASDNQTVAKVKAIVACDPSAKYSAKVNGTINTTVSSAQPGARIDVDSANSNADRVLETTATRTASTAANFYDWGTDPDDSTRLIVSIAQSELMSKLG